MSAEAAEAGATAGSGSPPVPAAASEDAPPRRGHALGIGEPRVPEPFTREQRLLHAARTNDRATLERALALGVSVEAKDDLGRSALLLAARDARSLDLVRFLHEQGAAIDEPDVGGRTALSWAATRGDLAIVEYLVAEGAEVDRRDAHARTPLFYAAIANHAQVVSFLAARGAEVDATGRFDETPLIGACAKQADAAARRLLELGADPSRVDARGRSGRDRARGGSPACLEAAPPGS